MTIHIAIPAGDTLVITGTPVPTLRWHVGPIQQKTGGSMPIEVTMTTEEKCLLRITPMTAAGNPAPVDGPAQ